LRSGLSQRLGRSTCGVNMPSSLYYPLNGMLRAFERVKYNWWGSKGRHLAKWLELGRVGFSWLLPEAVKVPL